MQRLHQSISFIEKCLTKDKCLIPCPDCGVEVLTTIYPFQDWYVLTHIDRKEENGKTKEYIKHWSCGFYKEGG